MQNLAENVSEILTPSRFHTARVIHGTRDRTVPIGMGRKVFDAATGQKTFQAIEGGGHNDLSTRYADSYWAAIAGFIAQTAKRR